MPKPDADDADSVAAAVKEDLGNVVLGAASTNSPDPSEANSKDAAATDAAAAAAAEEDNSRGGPNDDCIIMEGDITAIPFPGGGRASINVGNGELALGSASAGEPSASSSAVTTEGGHPSFSELEFKGKWFFNLSQDSAPAAFKYTLNKSPGDVYHPATLGVGSYASLPTAEESSQSCLHPVFQASPCNSDDNGASTAQATSTNGTSAAASSASEPAAAAPPSGEQEAGAARGFPVRAWQTAFLTGKWGGEFAMNKPRSQQHVKEKFSLRCATHTKGKEGDDAALIGITGHGKNRFGYFEVEGHFNYKSGHLRFAKYYVTVEKVPKVKKLKKRRKKTAVAKKFSLRQQAREAAAAAAAAAAAEAAASPGAGLPTTPGRRSTRKRTVSTHWTTDLGASDEEGPQHLSTKGRASASASASKRGKRTRGSATAESEPSVADHEAAADSSQNGGAKTKRDKKRREKRLAEQRLARSGFSNTVDLSSPSVRAKKGRSSIRRQDILKRKCDVCDRKVHPHGQETLLTCSECYIRVHPRCYGVGEGTPGAPVGDLRSRWKCDWCSLDVHDSAANRPRCEICLQADGAIKTTSDLRWCCVACVYWTDSVSFLNPVSLKPIVYLDPASGCKIPFEEMPADETAHTCTICGETGGICQPCAAPDCDERMHPRCARARGYYMEATEAEAVVTAPGGVGAVAAGPVAAAKSAAAAAVEEVGGSEGTAEAATDSTAIASSPEAAASADAAEAVPEPKQLGLEVEKLRCRMYCKDHTDEILVRVAEAEAQAAGTATAPSSRRRKSNDEADADDEDGPRYEGELLEGLPHGYGVYFHSDSRGHMYEGQWLNGKWHGYGVLSDATDRVFFAGEFANGQCNGKGTYFHSDGSTYCGLWKDNKCHGQGTFTDTDGNKFTGMWKRNKRDGKGTCWYKNGLVYEGEWRNDEPHGAGSCTTAEGFVFKGQFSNGYVEGRGHCTFPNGSVYKGNFRHGRKEGRGTLTFANGAVYEGSFRDDEPAGGSIGTFRLPVTLECLVDKQGQLHIAPEIPHSAPMDGVVPVVPGTPSAPKTPAVRRSKRGRSDPAEPTPASSSDASTDVDVAAAKKPNLPEGDDIADYLWLIPIDFGTDMQRIHSRAGFTTDGQ